MNIISTKQLRENFEMVKRGIEEGLSFILIYRSKPLAEIKPIKKSQLESEEEKNRRIKKNLELVKKLSGGLKLGRGLTPEQLNKLYRKTYEKLLP